MIDEGVTDDRVEDLEDDNKVGLVDGDNVELAVGSIDGDNDRIEKGFDDDSSVNS